MSRSKYFKMAVRQADGSFEYQHSRAYRRFGALVVTEAWNGYVIFHEATGLGFGPAFKSIRKAYECAERLSIAADWSAARRGKKRGTMDIDAEALAACKAALKAEGLDQ